MNIIDNYTSMVQYSFVSSDNNVVTWLIAPNVMVLESFLIMKHDDLFYLVE